MREGLTIYMTFITISTTSGGRDKNVWSPIGNISRQSTNILSFTKLFKYLDTKFNDFQMDSEGESLNILAWWRDHIRNFAILYHGT